MRKRDYTHIFFAHNGTGPYECFFCHEPVTFWETVVHHKDHDRENNDPTNLKPAHDFCHGSYHSKGHKRNLGKRRTPEQRRHLSEGLKRRWEDPEYRARLSRAQARRRRDSKGRYT